MDAASKDLIAASIKGSVADFEKANSALSKGPHDIKDGSGSNALHLAAQNGHAELAAHLIDSHGFDANTQLDAQGRSALGVAVAANQLDTVKMLLQKGGNASTVGPHGPLLMGACTNGHAEVVASLLESGADPNSVSQDGMPAVFLTSAMAAVKLKLPGREKEAAGGIECLHMLLNAGANPNVAAPGGFTPLHVAAEAGNEDMVQGLLKAGADASAKTADGQTPADVAASWGHRSVVETLLKANSGDTRSVDQVIKEAQLKEEADAKRKAEEKIASIVPAPEEPDDEKAEAFKKEGNSAFVAGDFEQALEAYHKALRHKTDSAPVWSNAAAACLRLKKWDGALKYARIARTLDPKFVKAWYREGQAAEGLRMWEDAAAAYFEAHLLDPNNDINFAELVKSTVEEGKKEHAAKLKAEAGGQ